MLEEDLRSRIAADAEVSAVVPRKAIAWGDRPQASGLPAITLDFIDDARPQHMTGFQDLRGTQVQVDVWSADKLQARDVRELVIAAVVAAGTIGSTAFRRSFVDRLESTFEQSDAGTVVYRERIDFTVWHSGLS